MPKQGPATQGSASVVNQLGAILFAVMFAAAMLFYAWSVFEGARGIVDWLLIVPAAVVGAVLLLWSALKESCRVVHGIRQREISATPIHRTQPVALLILMVLYAGSVEFIGFDLGTLLFLAIALFIQGERRWWLIALNALGGTWVLVWVFRDLLLVRLPTLL